MKTTVLESMCTLSYFRLDTLVTNLLSLLALLSISTGGNSPFSSSMSISLPESHFLYYIVLYSLVPGCLGMRLALSNWVWEHLHLISEATSQTSWTTRLGLWVAVGANAPTFLVTVPPLLRLLHPHCASFWSDCWVWRTPFLHHHWHQGQQRRHNPCLHPRCYPFVSGQSLWAVLFDVLM